MGSLRTSPVPFQYAVGIGDAPMRLRDASLVCRDPDLEAVWRERYGMAETIYGNSLMTAQVFSVSVTQT